MEVCVGPSELPKTLAELNQDRWDPVTGKKVATAAVGGRGATTGTGNTNPPVKQKQQRIIPQAQNIVATANPFDHS